MSNAVITQAGLTAIVPAPAPKAAVTQTGLTAIVPGPPTHAIVTQTGRTAILQSNVTKAQVTQAGRTVIVSSFPPYQENDIAWFQLGSDQREGGGPLGQSTDGSGIAGHVAMFGGADGKTLVDGGVGPGAGASSVPAIRTTAVSTAMSNSDYTVVATAPSITITLPPSPVTGQVCNVKNGNSTVGQLITVSSGTSANIDTATSVSIGATSSLMVQWDGAQWRII